MAFVQSPTFSTLAISCQNVLVLERALINIRMCQIIGDAVQVVSKNIGTVSPSASLSSPRASSSTQTAHHRPIVASCTSSSMPVVTYRFANHLIGKLLDVANH